MIMLGLIVAPNHVKTGRKISWVELPGDCLMTVCECSSSGTIMDSVVVNDRF